MGHIQRPVQQPRRVRPRHAVGTPPAPPPRGLAVQQARRLPNEGRDVVEGPVFLDAEAVLEVRGRERGVLVHALRRERVRRSDADFERSVGGHDKHSVHPDALQIGRYDPVVALPPA